MSRPCLRGAGRSALGVGRGAKEEARSRRVKGERGLEGDGGEEGIDPSEKREQERWTDGRDYEVASEGDVVVASSSVVAQHSVRALRTWEKTEG